MLAWHVHSGSLTHDILDTFPAFGHVESSLIIINPQGPKDKSFIESTNVQKKYSVTQTD